MSLFVWGLRFRKKTRAALLRTWLHQKLSPGITIFYNFRSYPRAYFNLGSCVFVLDTLHLEPSLFCVEFNPGDKIVPGIYPRLTLSPGLNSRKSDTNLDVTQNLK